MIHFLKARPPRTRKRYRAIARLILAVGDCLLLRSANAFFRLANSSLRLFLSIASRIIRLLKAARAAGVSSGIRMIIEDFRLTLDPSTVRVISANSLHLLTLSFLHDSSAGRLLLLTFSMTGHLTLLTTRPRHSARRRLRFHSGSGPRPSGSGPPQTLPKAPPSAPAVGAVPAW